MEAARTTGTIAVAALALAGCGTGQVATPRADPGYRLARSGDAETLTVIDAPGDVNGLNNEPAIAPRTALDLRRVVLRRGSERLRVELRTAARSRAPMKESFASYGNVMLRDELLEVRFRAGHEPRAFMRGPNLRWRRVPVELRGRSTIVELPLGRFTRREVFKWQAWTSATARSAEIADTLPDRYGNITFFPRAPRSRFATANEAGVRGGG